MAAGSEHRQDAPQLSLYGVGVPTRRRIAYPTRVVCSHLWQYVPPRPACRCVLRAVIDAIAPAWKGAAAREDVTILAAAYSNRDTHRDSGRRLLRGRPQAVWPASPAGGHPVGGETPSPLRAAKRHAQAQGGRPQAQGAQGPGSGRRPRLLVPPPVSDTDQLPHRDAPADGCRSPRTRLECQSGATGAARAAWPSAFVRRPAHGRVAHLAALHLVGPVVYKPFDRDETAFSALFCLVRGVAVRSFAPLAPITLLRTPASSWQASCVLHRNTGGRAAPSASAWRGENR